MPIPRKPRTLHRASTTSTLCTTSTKVALALALPLAFACTASPPAADEDTETDGLTEDTSGSDESDTGTAQNPDPCDAIVQDCVEADASKCAVFPSEVDESAELTCVEPLGDADTHESCVRPNGIAGEDTCAAGHYCAWWGQPVSDPQSRQCLELCDVLNPCEDGGDVCVTLSQLEQIGVCGPGCDPLAGGECGEGQSCVLDGVLSTTTSWDFHCSIVGSGAEGDACQADFECGEDLSCVRPSGEPEFACTAICTDADPCAGDQGCVSLVDDYGACVASDWSCVGAVELPEPMQATASVDLMILLPEGPTEVTYEACGRDDVACDAPLGTVVSARGETVALDVPLGAEGFDGYFQVSIEGFPDQLYYPRHTITGDDAVEITGWSTEFLGSLVGDLDPERGTIVSFVYACDGAAGKGARMASDLADDASEVVYDALTFPEGPLAPAASGSGRFGMAAITHHPVGYATTTVDLPVAGTVAQRSVHVRAGALTQVDVEPSPLP